MPSSTVEAPAPPALDCPPPENSETKLLPSGSGSTGANGSCGMVSLEEEELSSPLELVVAASDTHCPTVPKSPVTAFATAVVVLVPTTFVRACVRGCTSMLLAGAIPEEEK